MKKKGFTLIELLAVIIILAVIALIATPIVLNVVENAKKQANKNSVYGIIDSAKLYYAESLLDSSKSSNINGSTNLIDEIKVSGNKPNSGVLYINNKGETALAIIYDNVCYNKNFTERDLTESEDTSNCTLNIEEQKVCRVTEGTGENIGDVITCGTESFYVINTTGDNIRMLSMYNLEVGNDTNSGYPATVETNKQSINANFEYATVAFSSDTKKGINYSDYEGSIVEEYVDAYKTILEDMGVNVIDASLITKEELNALGCGEEGYCTEAPSFVNATYYWSSTPADSQRVFTIYSGDKFQGYTATYPSFIGVRPAITISKSDL